MAGNRGVMPPLPSGAKEEMEQESAESLLPPPAPPVEPVLPPEPPKRNKPLEVVAVRDGFYKGERRSPKVVNKDGSPKTFTIPDMSHLGSWMKLVDPVLEKKRQEEEKKNKKQNFLSMKKKDSAGK
jgi:hypothetical protein